MLRYALPQRNIIRTRSKGLGISLPRLMSYARVPIPEKMEIHLTEVENEICTILDDCATWMRSEKGMDTSCRIAGGWVRDKLLGMESNDIDIALTDMMGMTFAEQLVAYCATVRNMEVDKIAKVESNPDRSKHLETAKTKILGVELDFVNLRSEEYAENSRIPTQVMFGTPVQDALRRDITINALFYNIHSRSVEDFTEKGLEDIKNGIVRTPLPPKETFMDDPLRVIRCIRFASRFGFELVDELRKSAEDPQIQEALINKISRERVGEEIDKMMKGQNPLHSLQLVDELGLYESIFHIPTVNAPVFSSPPSTPHVSFAAASILSLLTHAGGSSLPPLHSILADSFTRDTSTKPRLYLACALLPYLGSSYQDHKQKWKPAVEAVIREGLKLGVQNHYLDGIPALFSACELLKDPKTGTERERRDIGLLMRDKSVHNSHTGSFWASSLLFSLVQELVPFWDSQHHKLDVHKARQRIEVYNKFVTRAVELDLPGTVDAKHILDGREVVRILETGKPGPWTGQVLNRVIEWQLEHPEGTKEQCEEWLKGEKVAGRIDVNVAQVQRFVQSKRGRDESRDNNHKRSKGNDDQV